MRQGLHFLRAELPGILASAPTCPRLACCASSRTFPETGSGWMSASRISPTRLQH
jgi:hypothetical protein